MQKADVSEASPLSDTYCVSCGYNLRGHKSGQNCPECGTHIRLEVIRSPDLLENQSRPWLTSANRGLRFVRLWLLSLIAFGVLRFFNRTHIGNVDICIVLILPMTGFALVGFWGLTFPNPRLSQVSSHENRRILARWSVFLVPCAIALGYVCMNVISSPVHVVRIVERLSILLGFCGLMVYLVPFADMMHDAFLTRSIRSFGRLSICVLAVYFLNSIFSVLSLPRVPWTIIGKIYALILEQELVRSPVYLAVLWRALKIVGRLRHKITNALAQASIRSDGI